MARPDFPKTLAEFQVRFATEDACRRYLMESRWPNGYRCPRCGHAEAYPVVGRGLLQCRACRYQVSVTAGTVMHRTRVPLRDWFWAAYLVTTHTPGFSAWQLQRQLGLGRYETSWTMLQKLRRAMIRPERERMAGTVEVDESYVGGVEEGRGGGRKRDSSKSIVVAAVEVRGRGTGRIRLGVVPDVSGLSLVGFVEASVAPGSTVRTDGWQGYAPLNQHGYDHRPTTQGAPKEAATLFPRVHRVFTHLKTWLWGTHRHVSRKHLPHYLNEFVFRFNRRRTTMGALESLLGLSGQLGPTTYSALYSAE
jgi:transposase-like protein/ribosomal protein L37AE/L43A